MSAPADVIRVQDIEPERLSVNLGNAAVSLRGEEFSPPTLSSISSCGKATPPSTTSFHTAIISGRSPLLYFLIVTSLILSLREIFKEKL